MTQPSSAQTNAPVAEAIDDCGLRFLLASRHHVYLLNTLPLRQRAQMQQLGLSPAYYVWAAQLTAVHAEGCADVGWDAPVRRWLVAAQHQLLTAMCWEGWSTVPSVLICLNQVAYLHDFVTLFASPTDELSLVGLTIWSLIGLTDRSLSVLLASSCHAKENNTLLHQKYKYNSKIPLKISDNISPNPQNQPS